MNWLSLSRRVCVATSREYLERVRRWGGVKQVDAEERHSLGAGET